MPIKTIKRLSYRKPVEPETKGVTIDGLMNLDILIGKVVNVFNSDTGKWRQENLTRRALISYFYKHKEYTKIEV